MGKDRTTAVQPRTKKRRSMLALLCVFALALTVLVGIGFTKPETAYAEGSGVVKQKLTTQISAENTDIEKMDEYGTPIIMQPTNLTKRERWF